MGAAIITYSPSTGVLIPLKEGDEAATEPIQLRPSSTYPAGQVVGEITASAGIYGIYAAANTDGTQIPTHLVMYSCVTDAQGNVYLGSTATSEWGQSTTYMPAYRKGYFSCADLVGLDANAVTRLGRLTEGSPSAGRFQMYGN
jgi:hypothetical protein